MSKRSVVAVAEEIFLKIRKPLHYKKLTELLIKECNLTGRTPHETVRGLIGTSPRFKRVAEGTYALSSWTEYPVARFAKDIAYDILKKRGKPISIVSLGMKILEERIFVGGPSVVVRWVCDTDKRFYLEKESDMISLVEWRIKK